MALPIPADPPATPLYWWEVPWVCGTLAGVRHVRAPDAQSAEQDLEKHPSDYGLAHENVLVGTARLLGEWPLFDVEELL